MKTLKSPSTWFLENNDLSLSQANPFRKSHHFVYVQVLKIVHDILCSRDAQYNTEESPRLQDQEETDNQTLSNTNHMSA